MRLGPFFYNKRKARQDEMFILTFMLYCTSTSCKIQVAKVATKRKFQSPKRKSQSHWRPYWLQFQALYSVQSVLLVQECLKFQKYIICRVNQRSESRDCTDRLLLLLLFTAGNLGGAIPDKRVGTQSRRRQCGRVVQGASPRFKVSTLLLAGFVSRQSQVQILSHAL